MPATHEYAGISAWDFKLKAEVVNYEQAREFLSGRNIAYLGPQMIIAEEHCEEYAQTSFFAVVLYNTEIIRYYPDDTFSVDNGGFNTLTTTERLQAVLPDGFRCFHFSTHEIKGKLGLIYGDSPWPRRRKVQASSTLWPLDHSRRITLDGRFV